jgi:hypothetical protein
LQRQPHNAPPTSRGLSQSAKRITLKQPVHNSVTF